MQNFKSEKPIVLVFGGHDPSGSAGIHADVETIAAHGCHAASVITMLTTQTVREFHGYKMPDINDFRQQSHAILESMDVRSIKIGAVGNLEILATLVDILSEEDSLPIILDPVMLSTSGFNMMGQKVKQALVRELLPMVEVLTPNSHEARLLTQEGFSLDQAAEELLGSGCQNVLITGTHENTPTVKNTHYTNERNPLAYDYQRLPGVYRGSGCILSSSIAANLALGINITDAIKNSLEFTWNCLNAASHCHKDTIIPDRITWKLIE